MIPFPRECSTFSRHKNIKLVTSFYKSGFNVKKLKTLRNRNKREHKEKENLCLYFVALKQFSRLYKYRTRKKTRCAFLKPPGDISGPKSYFTCTTVINNMISLVIGWL